VEEATRKAEVVAVTEVSVPRSGRCRVQPRRLFADAKERALSAAVGRTLQVAALVLAAGCADHLEPGLLVEDVDATFGLARVDPDEAAAEAGASSAPGPAGSDDSGVTVTPEEGGAAGSVDAAEVDAGPPPRSCSNVAGFTEKVTPALVDRCVRCHDGTKSKATKTLDLTTARDLSVAAQQRACDQMLKGAPDASERSPVFAEVNPSDAMTVHDFKYPSSMAYMAYRAAVLAWLEREVPVN
jgi:hypothetical protein